MATAQWKHWSRVARLRRVIQRHNRTLEVVTQREALELELAQANLQEVISEVEDQSEDETESLMELDLRDEDAHRRSVVGIKFPALQTSPLPGKHGYPVDHCHQ